MKNFKLVKTTAALALGASVVTAAVVPGTTSASAASKYKVTNGKLVNAKTGKVVKGYVVFKSKLYYNGKLKKGYKTVGSGKTIKLYYNGSLKKGYKTARNSKLLFFNGSLKKGYKSAGSGERLYKDGFLAKGYEVYGDVDKNPKLYYNGYLKSGYKTANNATLLFYNGELKKGYKTAKEGTVLYKDGRLNEGLVELNGVLYDGSKQNEGKKLFEGTLYDGAKRAIGLVKFEEKYYNDGVLANGEFVIDGEKVTIENGVLVGADTEAPVLKVDGETSITVENGAELKLPVVTATDNNDKEVEVKSVITDAEGKELKEIDTKVAGTYKVTYSAEDAAGNKAEDVVVTVVVKEGALKVGTVSAINATQATVTFSGAVKEVKPANVKVTDKDGNVVFVSKTELSQDGKTLTLSFIDKFAKDATYKVELTNLKDSEGKDVEKQEASFKYEAAAVSKVEVTQTTVAPGTDLAEVVKVTDALGRDVSAEHKVTFESADTTIVDAEGKVQANTAGKSVIVEAVVNDGKNTIKSGKISIKVQAEKATTFVGSYVTAGAVATTTENFVKNVKPEDKINYVHMEDANKNLGVYFNDQYGNSMNVLGLGTATITNLTPATVIVNDDFTIKPISEGTGYVRVKVGEVEKTIAIEVKAKATATEMNLDKSEVSVVAGKAAATVTAEFKDQFGNKITPTGDVTIKKDVTDEKIAKAVVEGKTVKISGVAEGTTTVTVEFKVGDKTLSKDIKVKVAKAGDLAKYSVALKDAKLDLGNTTNDAEKTPRSTTLVVNEVDVNGNVLGEATNVTLTEVDKDGNVVTDGSKQLLGISGNTVTAKAKGTAYVQVKVGSLVIDTVTVDVVNTAIEATSIDFDRLDVAVTDVTTAAGNIVDGGINIEEALKPIIKIIDQNGKVMKDTNGVDIKASDVQFATTNAVGLEVGTDANAGKITRITAPSATVDVVVTSVKASATGENLLTKPVTVKFSLKQHVEAVPANAKTELAVEGLTSENAKFYVANNIDTTTNLEKAVTLAEAKTFIDTRYSVNFNTNAIKIEDNKVSIVGSVLSPSDWYKVKANGNNTQPYRVTIAKDGTRVAKIAMYANGTAVIEDLTNTAPASN